MRPYVARAQTGKTMYRSVFDSLGYVVREFDGQQRPGDRGEPAAAPLRWHLGFLLGPPSKEDTKYHQFHLTWRGSFGKWTAGARGPLRCGRRVYQMYKTGDERHCFEPAIIPLHKEMKELGCDQAAGVPSPNKSPKKKQRGGRRRR